MQYTITGADRTTGNDATLTLEAKNAAEAESIASLSMLVSQVSIQPAEKVAVAYATPVEAGGPTEIDWSTGIVLYARLLRIASLVLAVMAVVPTLEYFWELGVSAWYLTYFVTLRRVIDLLEQVTSSSRLLLAVTLLAAALLMRLAANVALAVREIASSRQ